MKTSLVVTMIFLAASSTLVYAQEIELRISGGYAYGIGGSVLRAYEAYTANGATVVQGTNDEYFSAGQGARFSGGAVIYIYDNFGIFVQSSYTAADEEVSPLIPFSGLQSGVTRRSESTKSRSVSGEAGVHIQLKQDFISPYCGVGAGVFYSTGLTIGLEIVDNNHSVTEQEYTVSTPIGFVGYIGAGVRISEAILLTVEAKTVAASFHASELEYTKYNIDGVDRLGELSTRIKKRTFEEDKNYTLSNDMNTPSFGGPPPPIPLSSLAITIGFSIQL